MDTSHPDYNQGVWALNSPVELYATLHNDLLMNLYIADVDGTATEISTNGDTECNWYAWAGLNDVIATEDDNLYPMYTGIFLGPGSEAVDLHWACTYEPWVERARLEAAQHPAIVKVVELDELHRLMDGPDTSAFEVWKKQASGVYETESHWSPDNVEALHDMVASGSYGGLDVDADGNTSSTCTTGSYTMSGTDLELWSRMVSVEVPRYIMRSAVLGMPGDPVAVAAHLANNDDDSSNDISPVPADDPDYAFEAGDAVKVLFSQVAPTPPNSTAHPLWSANLEFFYVPAESRIWSTDLNVLVDGTKITDVSEHLTQPHDYRTIYHSSTCIGGPGCSSSSVWDSTAGASNTVAFQVKATGSTSPRQDRLAYVWGVRLSYTDNGGTTTLWESDLNPDLATYSATTSLSSSAAIYQDNSDWRVTDYIDGLTIASIDYLSFDATDWDAFMEDTCDYLHSFNDPKRCVLDERASWNNYGDYYDPFVDDDGDGVDDEIDPDIDLSVVGDRLPSGDDYGDGLMTTWLPTPIEFEGVEGGRFDEKEALDYYDLVNRWPIMLYEPRQSRSIPGETHQFTATVATGCDADYTAYWNIVAAANSPQYHWYLEYEDGSVSGTDWKTLAEGLADTSDTDNMSITGVAAGDQFRVRWVDLQGGGGPYAANYAEFRVMPPTALLGSCMPTWVHDTDLVGTIEVWDSDIPGYTPITLDTSPTQVYDCITEYFASGTTGSCL